VRSELAGTVPRLTKAKTLTLDARSPATKPTAPATPHKVVYLTFDDGPSTTYTRQILAILDRYDAKATFFVIGRQTPGAKAVVRAEYAAGHGVGNHTWSHANLRRASAQRFASQVGSTQRVITAATGHAPVCLRPPMGAVAKNTRLRAKRHHALRVQLWNVDTYDWKNPGTTKIARRGLAARDGSVVLLHDGGGNRAQTVKALPSLLWNLKVKGFTFKALCR
jgi:peptidoglycan/xylan/chitin deacetylase (PgdA/CDA1 family)